MKRYSAIVMITLLVLSCSKPMNSGLDMSHFDKSVRPQDDLYKHVNGKWLDSFDIPADKSNYGSFTKLYDESQVNLRKIIEESAKENAAVGTDKQKVGDLYASYMDTVSIEKMGISPLKPYLTQIINAKSKAELNKVAVTLGKIGVGGLFSFWIGQDAKKSDEYISNVYQSGLSLPDKSYYSNSDQKFVDIREKFVSHIEIIFNLAGISDALVKAKRILAIETEIAKNHWARVDNRNADKTYNKYTIQILMK